MFVPLPPVPPFPYRDPKNDRHEGEERARRPRIKSFEFSAGFAKTFGVGPVLCLMLQASRKMELGTWIAFLLLIVGMGGLFVWRLREQRKDRPAAFTNGLVWGAAAGLLAFVGLARLLF